MSDKTSIRKTTDEMIWRDFVIKVSLLPLVCYLVMRIDCQSMLANVGWCHFGIGFVVVVASVSLLGCRMKKGFSGDSRAELVAELDEVKYLSGGISLGSVIQIKGLSMMEIAFALSIILLLALCRRKLSVAVEELNDKK